eukprot:5682393-Alexandrium_andersonii.AAC.1
MNTEFRSSTGPARIDQSFRETAGARPQERRKNRHSTLPGRIAAGFCESARPEAADPEEAGKVAAGC